MTTFSTCQIIKVCILVYRTRFWPAVRGLGRLCWNSQGRVPGLRGPISATDRYSPDSRPIRKQPIGPEAMNQTSAEPTSPTDPALLKQLQPSPLNEAAPARATTPPPNALVRDSSSLINHLSPTRRFLPIPTSPPPILSLDKPINHKSPVSGLVRNADPTRAWTRQPTNSYRRLPRNTN